MLYSSPEEGRCCRGIERALLRIIILIPEISVEIIYGEQTNLSVALRIRRGPTHQATGPNSTVFKFEAFDRAHTNPLVSCELNWFS